MRSRSASALAITALLLILSACQQDPPAQQAPLSAAENEGLAALFVGLAQAAAESGESAQAGALFVVAANFQKDVQKAHWREAGEASGRGDTTGFNQALAAAGRAARRAADIMMDAARSFEAAGNLEDAWRTYFEAAQCYGMAAADFLLAGDTASEREIRREAANARAQGAAVQRQIAGNP